MSKKHTTLIISDLHAPFHNLRALQFLTALKKEFQPDTVVCVGDEVDFHRISRWPSDPSAKGTMDELTESIAFLKQLYKVFPNVKVCTSNHTARPFKLAFNMGLPSVFLKSYHDFLEAPKGWEWRDTWKLNGVLYIHGEPFTGRNAIQNAIQTHRMPVVMGHVHSNAGVMYMNNGHDTLWGMNTGCLIDPEAYAFEYGKHNRDKPVLGCGVVVDDVPYFIPM